MDEQLELEIIDVQVEEIEKTEPQELEVWLPKANKPISFLRCSSCFLKAQCPLADESTEVCSLESLENIETSTGDGLIKIIQEILAIQARRVLRLAKWEEIEGGLPEPTVTKEMKNMIELIEQFKRIVSDENSLTIRASGKSASGVIEKLFGG